MNQEVASLRSANQLQTPQTRIQPTVRCPECLGRGHVDIEQQRNINYANSVCRLCGGIGLAR